MHRPSPFSVLRTACVLVALGALLVPAAGAKGAPSDPSAVAERLLAALGGREALERSRHVRFDFFGVRTHHWDRYTGRHRLEGKSRDGSSYLILHDVNTRQGRVWVDGEEKTGEEAAKRLEAAYGAWINDVYWLLMPYKLLDPGVSLAYAGEEEIDGAVYDKVELTFESVGLTPGDTYWAYVNRETGLMDRWAYHLQDWEADREPQTWLWLEWQRYGPGIMLSSLRRDPASGREARLGDIAIFDQLPDSVYDSPEPVAE